MAPHLAAVKLCNFSVRDRQTTGHERARSLRSGPGFACSSGDERIRLRLEVQRQTGSHAAEQRRTVATVDEADGAAAGSTASSDDLAVVEVVLALQLGTATLVVRESLDDRVEEDLTTQCRTNAATLDDDAGEGNDVRSGNGSKPAIRT